MSNAGVLELELRVPALVVEGRRPFRVLLDRLDSKQGAGHHRYEADREHRHRLVVGPHPRQRGVAKGATANQGR